MSAHRLLALLLLVVLGLGACSGDDDAASDDDGGGTVPPLTATTTPPETGGLDIPEIPGTTPAPLTSLGIGLAVPDGWQATRLDAEALERLAEADLARPSFLEAARRVAETGAVFYAAGIDDEGRVSELKIDVQDDADTNPEAMRDLAGSVVESGQVTDGVVVEDDPQDDRVRVDYRIALPSAEDDEVIDALGSQLFVADGDRLWSIIITSEDTATQTSLLQIVDASLTFD